MIILAVIRQWRFHPISFSYSNGASSFFFFSFFSMRTRHWKQVWGVVIFLSGAFCFGSPRQNSFCMFCSWFSREDGAARATALVKRGWSKFSQDVEKDTAEKMANLPGTNQKQKRTWFNWIDLTHWHTTKRLNWKSQVESWRVSQLCSLALSIKSLCRKSLFRNSCVWRPVSRCEVLRVCVCVCAWPGVRQTPTQALSQPLTAENPWSPDNSIYFTAALG